MVLVKQIVIKKRPRSHLVKKLNETDFYPFKDIKSHIAMTAHILYPSLIKKMWQLFQKRLLKK